MAMISTATVAELLDALHVPPQRVLLRPAPGLATEDDLLRNPRLCELIDGVLVEKAMGWYESRLAAVLIGVLDRFLEQHDLGFVLDGTGMIRVDPGQIRLPDVSFFAWERFPIASCAVNESFDCQFPLTLYE